jgi:hypothetical protein
LIPKETLLARPYCQHQVERAWRQQQELLLDLIRLTQTDLEKPARQKARDGWDKSPHLSAFHGHQITKRRLKLAI